jgi:hypothetical protein
VNDFATLTNAPIASGAVDVNGRRLQFRKLVWSDYGRLQRWIDDQLPCPIRAVRRFLASPEGKETPVSQQRAMVEQAIAEAGKIRAPLGGEQATAIAQSPDGIVFIMFLMSRPFHPDLTYESLAALVAEMDPMDVRRIMEHSGTEVIEKKESTTPSAESNGSTPGDSFTAI